jgi:hypothetical protein
MHHGMPVRRHRVVFQLKVEELQNVFDVEDSFVVDFIDSNVAANVAAVLLLVFLHFLAAQLSALLVELWWHERERKLTATSRVVSFHELSAARVGLPGNLKKGNFYDLELAPTPFSLTPAAKPSTEIKISFICSRTFTSNHLDSMNTRPKCFARTFKAKVSITRTTSFGRGTTCF